MFKGKTTQSHIPIREIRDNVVISNDGSVALVLQTNAVNFDLLSDREQLAIIDAFAALLNSLSFSIQIVIRSKRLDVSHYLEMLAVSEKRQNNPLLRHIMQSYREFVATLIRENEVLDKQFYLVIPVSSLELGIINDIDKHYQKAITILIPRRDHLIKQCNRMGVQAEQMTTEKLLNLFYDYYNEENIPDSVKLVEQVNIKIDSEKNSSKTPQLQTPQPVAPPVSPPQQPVQAPIAAKPNPPQQSYYAPPAQQSKSHVPFVTEEVSDDYGAV